MDSLSLATFQSRLNIFLKDNLCFQQELIWGSLMACIIWEVRLDDHNDLFLDSAWKSLTILALVAYVPPSRESEGSTKEGRKGLLGMWLPYDFPFLYDLWETLCQ